MSRAVDVHALVEDAAGTDPARRARAVGRLLSLVEDAHPAVPELMAALTGAPSATPAEGLTRPRADVVGITGPPGVGKSTMTAALIGRLRETGRTVGVLAVDPSSPFSGGALLGDRVRMEAHGGDAGVLIRSMASRGHLGGLAAGTTRAVRVLEATGFDVVLVETVGVGQSEVEVAALADTTVVLLAPGAGDGIQAAKAGILEVGDVFVVNKADRGDARSTARDLRHMISLGERPGPAGWRPPVVLASAVAGTGLDDVLAALAGHARWLVEAGQRDARRRRRAAAEIEAVALGRVRAGFGDRLEALAAGVVAGRLTPDDAAGALLSPSSRPASAP